MHIGSRGSRHPARIGRRGHTANDIPNAASVQRPEKTDLDLHTVPYHGERTLIERNHVSRPFLIRLLDDKGSCIARKASSAASGWKMCWPTRLSSMPDGKAYSTSWRLRRKSWIWGTANHESLHGASRRQLSLPGANAKCAHMAVQIVGRNRSDHATMSSGSAGSALSRKFQVARATAGSFRSTGHACG